MTHLDLFSGIGGFALAASRVWNNHAVTAFCERDRYCQKILLKHWPGSTIHDDITTLDGTQYRGAVDLLTGGFPCQPFSTAGKRRGAEDDRALWPEMCRIIRECRPRWVVGENVPGLIRMELDTVLSDLEGEGYTCWTLVLPAVATDAQHRRDRVWIVAHDDGNGRQRTDLHKGQGREREREVVSVGDSQDVPDAHSDRERITGEGRGIPDINRDRETEERRRELIEHGSERNGQAMADTVRRKHTRQRKSVNPSHTTAKGEREANQPIDVRQPQIWSPEPGVGRVVAGIPHRVDRLRALGNAIVPQLATQLFEMIKEQEMVI